MGPPLRAELLKIRTTRLWWGLLVGVLVFTAVQSGFTAGFAGVQAPGQPASPGLVDPSAIRSVYASAAFTGAYLFAMILGITGMTGEARYQTLTPTFLAAPRRPTVVAAKAVAHALVGAPYAVVAVLTALLVGGIVITAMGRPLGYGAPGLWTAVLGAVVAVMLWTLIGIGVGTLIRNQVAAILLAVLVTFLVEPLLSFAFGKVHAIAGMVRYLPGNASSAMTSPSQELVHLLPAWAGGLVLLAYAAIFAGLGVWLTVRRDVT